MLADLRKSRGWTQTDLAIKAGYSTRLISKAECGKPISRTTLMDLAQALSTPENVVLPDDLSAHPVDLAKKFMTAVHTHGPNLMPTIEHLLAPDATFHISGNPAELPYAGTHRGIDAIKRMYEIMFSVFEIPKNHRRESSYSYFGKGNEVIIWGMSWIHPIGRPLNNEPVSTTHRLRFSRGKLLFFEDRLDTQTVNLLLQQTKLVMQQMDRIKTNEGSKIDATA
jgi:transcriptional regulator with XRE-family HTH domain